MNEIINELQEARQRAEHAGELARAAMEIAEKLADEYRREQEEEELSAGSEEDPATPSRKKSGLRLSKPQQLAATFHGPNPYQSPGMYPTLPRRKPLRQSIPREERIIKKSSEQQESEQLVTSEGGKIKEKAPAKDVEKTSDDEDDSSSSSSSDDSDNECEIIEESIESKSKTLEPSKENVESKTTTSKKSNKKGSVNQAERNELINGLKKLVMLLLPGQEVEWAIITQDLVNKLPAGNGGLKLQAITQQLKNHPDALAQAMALLIQAARHKDEDINPLQNFFDWLCVKYQSTSRQRRVQFAKLLKDISWTWQDNPADQIRDAVNKVHLTWNEVVQDTALREELKAEVAAKLDAGLFLTLSETPIAEWYGKITSFWNKLRDSKPLAVPEPAEVYVQNGDEELEEEECAEVMLVKANDIPKIKNPKPDFLDAHQQLREIVSALQTTVQQPINKNAVTKTQPNNSGPPQNTQGTRKCFRCGKIGHIRPQCRAILPEQGQNQGYQQYQKQNYGQQKWNKSGWQTKNQQAKNNNNWNANRNFNGRGQHQK